MAQRRQGDAGLTAVGSRFQAAGVRLQPDSSRLHPDSSRLHPDGWLLRHQGQAISLRRRALLTQLGAVGAMVGGCAIRPPRPTGPVLSAAGTPLVLPFPAPVFNLGQGWSYRVINRYNGNVVGALHLEVRALAPLTMVQRYQPSTGTTAKAATDPAATDRAAIDPAATNVEATAGETAVMLTFDAPWAAQVDAGFGEVYHFTPGTPLLPPRLEPHSRSNTTHRLTMAGNSGNYGWRQRVTAIGTEVLDTAIGRLDALVIQRDISFESPVPFRYDRRLSETRWYAPAINGWARRTWTGSYVAEGTFDFLLRQREDWEMLELTRYTPGA